MLGRIVCPLAVLVIVCVLRPGCVVGHCSDDHGDGTYLAARVLQFQDSVQRLQRQVNLQHAILTKQEEAIDILLNAGCCSYELFVTTGTAEGADIDHSKIFMQLYRGEVTTEWRQLDTPADDFERGNTDRFPFEDRCFIEPCIRLKTVIVPPRPRDWWYGTIAQLKIKSAGCRGQKTQRVFNYTFNAGFSDNVESRCPE